jgi:DNA-directed RNA polymerase specialized sigma24 family protein
MADVTLLLDAARRKRTEKHGGGRRRVDLPDLPANPEVADEPLLALDAALTRLAAEDAVAARVVELGHFAGLSIDDAATALGLTPRYIAQGLNMLRDMKSLKTIGIEYGDNGWPAAEFWERYDKGEFQ